MNIIGRRKISYIFSAITIVIGTGSLAFFGLKLSIDFTGGSMVEISEVKDIEKVKSVAGEMKLENFVVQSLGDQQYILKMKEINEEKHKEFKDKIKGTAVEDRFESVGPSVSEETTKKAFYLILIASLAIVLYVSYSFRKVPKPASSWQFGVTAVLALIHDAFVVLGVFAFLGYFLNVEVDSFFVTALLTIIGFSVHDTIVVYDRIREKLMREGSGDFEKMVNESINETLVRSLGTSFTVLLVLFAMYLIGESSTKNFVLALIIGISFGTYSSMCFASPLLVDWQRWREKRKN